MKAFMWILAILLAPFMIIASVTLIVAMVIFYLVGGLFFGFKSFKDKTVNL